MAARAPKPNTPKGVSIDMTEFNQGVAKLVGVCTRDQFVKALEKAAAFMIGKSMEVAPKDTGTLAGSGTWKKTGVAQITFGFNTEYAYVQDQGSVRMASKGYKCPVGPNEYFTGTLEFYTPVAFKIISDNVQRIMETT